MWRADQQVFVITFSRAGEDNKSFKVTDIENTFAGFAGADYDLQVGLLGHDGTPPLPAQFADQGVVRNRGCAQDNQAMTTQHGCSFVY